jgi:hypothetical protein
MTETFAVRCLIPLVFAASLAGSGLIAEEAKKEAAPAASGKTILQGLPRETFLLLHARDARSAIAKAKRSPFYKLKDHPDIKPLIAKISDEIKKELATAEANLGFKPEELIESIEGEVVIAIGNLDDLAGDLQQALSMGQEPKTKLDKFPLLLAADFGGSAPKAKERLAKLFEAAEKSGVKRTTADFRGGKITELLRGTPSPQGEAKKDEGKEKDGGEGEKKEGSDSGEEMKLYVGELGTHGFVGTSRKFLEECMGKFDKPEGEALLTNPHFLETRKVVRGGDDVFAFVNLSHLTSTINKALSNTFFAFYWQKVESLLFGKSLNNVGLSLLLEDAQVRQSIFVHNAGAADGLLGVLKTDPFAPSPPSFLPDSTRSFSVLGFNAARIEAMVREVAQIAAAFGQPAADIDGTFEQQFGVKLKDVFAAIGKKFHLFSQGGTESSDVFADLNLAVEVKDEEPFKKLLQKSVETYAGKLETSKYKEKDVYTLAGGGDGFSVALSDKLIIGGGSPGNVKAVLDRSGATSSKLGEEFQKNAGGVPGQVVGIGFANAAYMKDSLLSVAEMLEKNADDEEARKAVKAVAAAVADQLGPMLSYSAWTGAGLQADTFYFYKK